MEQSVQQTSRKGYDSLALAGILTLAGGFLEGYTYTCRGGVFANGQTGNIAKLGIAIVDGNLLAFFQRAIPITVFVLGISLAMTIQRQMESRQGLYWQQWVVLAEMLALLIVSFIPAGQIGDIFANAIVSFVCAIQFETFRKFNGNAFASTFCTGNLRSATESLNRFLTDRSPQELSRTLGYFGLITLFIFGTIFGVLGVRRMNVRATLLCCGVLCGAFLYIHWKERRKDP